jgi:hypothetical protein
MSAFMASAGFELHHLTDHKLWASLNKGLAVDLGGSHGDAMVALATAYHSLKCVVQDLSCKIESRPKSPSDVADQVTFMVHDFFEEQPVKNADVYYFRWIFHNWSDGYCLRIIRNLIPALKPYSRTMINDACLPEPGIFGTGAER